MVSEPCAVVTAAQARRMLMWGQGLLGDPARAVTPGTVHKLIERMGFVQVDTINVVERAHHHILLTRLDGYRPAMLTKLLEKDRKLFEHWTHDASIIPTRWLREWGERFARYENRGHSPNSWWMQRIGNRPRKVIDHVLERIRHEGPLMSHDFEHDRKGESGAWWRWKPQKAALEFLWRTGRLAVARRVNFQKVYDLAERVYPPREDRSRLSEREHCAWACRTALDHLGFATTGELAAFLRAITHTEAKAWAAAALADGQLTQVLVDSADGSPPRKSFAYTDWRRRLGAARAAPARMRLLSPFDPVLRDRRRTLRLFDFDYRFEAFVPERKRKYGYYVMPLLEKDRLVGRLDAKHHRDRGDLEIKALWWEPDVKVSGRRRAALEAELARFAAGIGAESVVGEDAGR